MWNRQRIGGTSSNKRELLESFLMAIIFALFFSATHKFVVTLKCVSPFWNNRNRSQQKVILLLFLLSQCERQLRSRDFLMWLFWSCDVDALKIYSKIHETSKSTNGNWTDLSMHKILLQSSIFNYNRPANNRSIIYEQSTGEWLQHRCTHWHRFSLAVLARLSSLWVRALSVANKSTEFQCVF